MTLLRIIVICLLSLLMGQTYLPLTGAGSISSSSPPSYSGPGDVVSGAVFFVGLRAYNAAYATGSNPAINITRASDSHTCDVLIATTGGLGNTANCSSGADNGQTAASFCTSTTCSIDEGYDQSGFNGCSSSPCNVAQTTAADQPALIVPSVSNGCPTSSEYCIPAPGKSTALIATNSFTSVINQPFTFISVIEANSHFASSDNDIVNSNNPPIGGGSQCNIFHTIDTSPNINNYAGNNATLSISSLTWYGSVNVFNSSSSAIYANALSGTGLNASSAAFSSGCGVSLLGDQFNTGNGVTIEEVGLYSSGFNSTQASNIISNQRTFWGF